MRNVWLVARKELLDCLQSRWLVSGALLFAILSLAVFFGTAAIGGSFAYPPLSVVMNSLVSLTVFLLPLLAILLAYDAFVGELEGGMLILMLTYPLSRTAFLLGKAIGQGAAVAIVLVLGFAVMPVAAAFAAVPYAVGEMMAALAVTAATAWLLGFVFMFAAYCVSLSVRTKAQALAILVLVWLAVVLLYDLGLLVAAVSMTGGLPRGVLNALMLANPASAFRLLNQSLFGSVASGVPASALTAVLIAWAAALFALARTIFARKRF